MAFASINPNHCFQHSKQIPLRIHFWKWRGLEIVKLQKITIVVQVYDILFGMIHRRINLPNRCCHLISRVTHRAFFLDADEHTRLADLIRRDAVWRPSLTLLDLNGISCPDKLARARGRGENIAMKIV